MEVNLLTKLRTVSLSAYTSSDYNQGVYNHQRHEMTHPLPPYLIAMLVYQRQNLHLNTAKTENNLRTTFFKYLANFFLQKYYHPTLCSMGMLLQHSTVTKFNELRTESAIKFLILILEYKSFYLLRCPSISNIN